MNAQTVARTAAKGRGIQQAKKPARRSSPPPAAVVRRKEASLSLLVDGLWGRLTSVRLALVLILLIAVAALAGALIMQAPPPAREDPQQFEQWLEGMARPKYGMWAGLMEKVQLFTVFSSPWFRLLVILLAANVLVCVTHRTPQLWRIARRAPEVRMPDSLFEKAPLAGAVAAGPITPAEATAQLAATLRRRRFSIRRLEADGAVHLVAEKNRYTRLATIIHHLGLVAVLLGVVIGSRGGWVESQFVIAEGDTRPVGHDTGLSVRLLSFMDEYYTEMAGMPKDYRSDVQVLKDGQEVKRGTVRVNEPVSYQGVRIHQAFYGPAIIMQVKDAAGTELFKGTVPLLWQAQQRPAGSFLLPSQGLEVFIIAPASAFIDDVIRPGQVRLEVYQVGGSEPLALENVAQGAQQEIAGLQYTFERESRFTGLQVVKDPGVPLIWLGSAMIVVGAFLVLTFPHRRLWARAERDAEGRTVVRLAATKERGMPFAHEFQRIVASTRGRLTPTRHVSKQ